MTENKTDWLKKLMWIPVIAVLAIVPVIARIYVFENHMTQYPWYIKNPESADYFLYWKGIILIIAAVLMAVLLVYRIFIKKEESSYKWVWIPIGAYVVLAFLSAVFSDYRYFSFAGSTDQFESIFVIMAYIMALAYGMYLVKTEEDIKKMCKILWAGVVILAFIGVTQIIGKDFINFIFNNDFFRMFTVPQAYSEMFEKIDKIIDNKTVYMSQYNSNYAGVYISMVLPICITILILARQAKACIYYGIAVIMLVPCLFFSQSKAGFIAVIATALFMVIFLRKIIFKKWKVWLIGAVCIVVAFFGANAMTGNKYLNTLVSALKIQKTERALTDMQTTDENITFKYKGNLLKVSYELDAEGNIIIAAKDENDKDVEIVFSEDSPACTFMDDRFYGIIVIPMQIGEEEYTSIRINIDGTDWHFTNQLKEGGYWYYNIRGRWDKMIIPEKAIFTEYESLATGRGYIWSRTIPLLKDNLILGSGPDTFTLVYPQSDYLGLTQNNFHTQLMTRPHSMYLQIAIQTGVLSLIAFLGIYLIYFLQCVKLYINSKFEDLFSKVGVAIFFGTIGYMVSGITNDSTVTVAPVFWMLLGIGFGINMKIQKDMKAKKSV